MATDDEIDKEINKIEKKLHDEFLVDPLLYVRLEALIYKKARIDEQSKPRAKIQQEALLHPLDEGATAALTTISISRTEIKKAEASARADTATQIFAELDKIIHGKGSTEIILRNKHVIFFGFKEYEAVKKKHKAD